MVHGTAASKMWKDMTKEEQIAFRAEKGELAESALKDALTVLFVEKQLKVEETKVGWEGEFLPLCVYKSKGYDDVWLTTNVGSEP